jgi:hypothetical protein
MSTLASVISTSSIQDETTYLQVLIELHDSFIELLLYSGQLKLILHMNLELTTLEMIRESSKFC